MMRKWPLSSKDSSIWPRRTRDSLAEAVASEDLAPEKRRIIRKDASTARSLVTSLLNVLNYKRTSQKREYFLDETWDELGNEEDSEKD